MGCFLACFGSKKKDRKRRKNSPKKQQSLPKDHQGLRRNVVEEARPPLQKKEEFVPSDDLNKIKRNVSNEPLEPINSSNKDPTEIPTTPVEEPRNKLEEQLSFGARKKVTFDLNVEAHDEKPGQEVESSRDEDAKEEKGMEREGLKSQSEDDSSSTSKGSYPPNHRYQNCTNSDEDYDDDSDTYSDAHDAHEGELLRGNIQEESSDSLFSLPSAVQKGGSEICIGEMEVNSPVPVQKSTRDRSQYSVLNPIENLTQWKEVKMGSKQSQKQQKEQVNSEKEVELPFSSEPSFKVSTTSPNTKTNRSGSPKEDVAVDTSLSTWLGSADRTSVSRTSNFSNGTESNDRTKSPRSSYSPRSHEDRPILGALTLDELRQFSATSSPRKSPSRSPDEIPIVGTVGNYWSHSGVTTDTSTSSPSSRKAGIPNTTSKYREDKIVHWHSTPFEKRLERALNTGEPEAYSC